MLTSYWKNTLLDLPADPIHNAHLLPSRVNANVSESAAWLGDSSLFWVLQVNPNRNPLGFIGKLPHLPALLR